MGELEGFEGVAKVIFLALERTFSFASKVIFHEMSIPKVFKHKNSDSLFMYFDFICGSIYSLLSE